MDNQFYLDLAARGVRMPIGADLLLHEEPDPPEEILVDAGRLGRVVEKAARRYRTPLAFPLMDLRLEKADLLDFAGVPADEVDLFHFDEPPSEELVASVKSAEGRPFSKRIQANQAAVRYIAERTDLLPVGMLIGPFSLMTKLAADPITPVALAGAGVSAEEDAGVRLADRCLELGVATVLRSARAQIEAGARAIILCEPAANTVYLSPRQMRNGSKIFERFVLEPNRRVRALLEQHGVDLIFHDCGELLTDMVREFAIGLRPVMISLGSSRRLWEDALVVPKNIVLFGNLPTKTFYSDAAMPDDKVESLTQELTMRMAAAGHPHILGSECDVLHVSDAARQIRRKVDIMISCGNRAGPELRNDETQFSTHCGSMRSSTIAETAPRRIPK
jgi:uroporphyrinogen-III decarboxylase